MVLSAYPGSSISILHGWYYWEGGFISFSFAFEADHLSERFVATYHKPESEELETDEGDPPARQDREDHTGKAKDNEEDASDDSDGGVYF